MIPAYNRTKYLEKTLRSVLSQDLGSQEMQIEVVDDASLVDDPEPVVRRIAGDRVSVVRNPYNIGLMPNFNNCVQRSFGHWVHILHTDDFVLPGFYERLKIALEARSDIGAAFCRHAIIDENERWLSTSELESPTSAVLPDFVREIGVTQRIQFPAMVVRRSVYEQWGGFRLDLPYTGDWEMWIRIAAHYPIWFEPDTLAAFRSHSTSASEAFKKSGESLVDMYRCIDISRSWLPPDRAETISRRATEGVFFVSLSETSQEKAVEELINASRPGPIRRSWLPPSRAEAISQGARESLYLWALSMISQNDAVLRLVEELINVSMPAPVHRSGVANALLRAAGIHYGQSRRYQALVFKARAVLARPIVAGRPLKRAVNSLFRKSRPEANQA